MAHLVETVLEHVAIPSWKTISLVAGSLAALQLLRWVVVAIYNLYWHPLRHFPCHVPWVVLPWGHSIARIQGKIDFQMRDLHEKLGPVIRTGPDSLSFTASAAWKDIYGGGHAELPKHLLSGSGLDELPDIIAANANDHRRYRRALAPAFTTEALMRQEPLINTYVDLLLQKLSEIARSSEPSANMANWYSMVSFDIFGDLCYGENFGGLEMGHKSPWIQAISDTKPVIALSVIPYISKLLLHWYLTAEQRDSLRVSQQMTTDATLKRIQNEEFNARGDIMSFLLRSRNDAKGLNDYEMCCNVDTIMGAAVDTTVIGLAGVTYCLVRHPDALERCTREVREAFDKQDDICFKEINTKLPFLLACIDEGLRLYPPTPIGLWRRTLPGPPTTISGYEVPENVRQGTYKYSPYSCRYY